MEKDVTIAVRKKQRKNSSWISDVRLKNTRFLTRSQVPRITVRGGTSKNRIAVIRAAVWMIFDQLGNRVAPQIILDIELIKNLIQDECVYGDCFAADSMRQIRPRYFQIRLDSGLGLSVLLETLAHEIIHLRQYAKDQLYEYRNGDNRYAGERYKKDCDDPPWEDEASKLERHLYQKYSSQL